MAETEESSYLSSSSNEMGDLAVAKDKKKGHDRSEPCRQDEQRARLVVFWGNFVLLATLLVGTLITAAAFVCLDNIDVLAEKTNGKIHEDNVSVP